MPFAQQAIQPATQLLRHDLARIAWADGGDDVWVNDGCFEAVQLFVKLNTIRCEKIPRQIRQWKFVGGKHALKSEVMNRDTNAWATPLPCALQLVLKQHSRQTRLPVMQVQQVQFRRQGQHELRHGFGKENEAFGIVRIITAIFLV